MKKINLIKEKFIKKFDDYLFDNRGVGVIEIVMILVVLIGLVIVFKDKIGTLLTGIFNNINNSATGLYN